MITRTLTFTPGPSTVREAITETIGAGNDGFAHLFDPAARPRYRFSVQVGPLVKSEVECLSALHAFLGGHRSFFWHGGAYRSVDDFALTGEGDGLRREYLLPNRYVTAASVAVRTLRPSTGATSETTAFSLYASTGLLAMATAPVSGDHLQAKYACYYRVNFASEGLKVDQVATDLYTAAFDLTECVVVDTATPVVGD